MIIHLTLTVLPTGIVGKYHNSKE